MANIPIVVASTTIGMLAISLLGITYSVLSASWDDDREGGALGIDEFKKNVGSVTQGVKRSRENQLLRERMAGLPESEIEAAIKDLEMREAREMKRTETLKEKMEKELSSLLFSPAELLVYLSERMSLRTGDLVSLGTPAGVGPLEHGDVCEIRLLSDQQLLIKMTNPVIRPAN